VSNGREKGLSVSERLLELRRSKLDSDFERRRNVIVFENNDSEAEADGYGSFLSDIIQGRTTKEPTHVVKSST
jgi:hypothetical protein